MKFLKEGAKDGRTKEEHRQDRETRESKLMPEQLQVGQNFQSNIDTLKVVFTVFAGATIGGDAFWYYLLFRDGPMST